LKCEYGCGQEATHQFMNGKWCCKNNQSLCPQIKKKISTHSKNMWDNPLSKVNTNEYRQILSNKNKQKWKDPNSTFNSLEFRKIMSDCQKGKKIWKEKEKIKHSIIIKSKWKDPNSKYNSEQSRQKLSNSMKKTWKDLNSIFNSKEFREKMSISKKGKKGHIPWNKNLKMSINEWKIKYPFFTKIENIKEDPETGQIQGHCKNHKCKNSKEKGGWFFPSYSQLYSRAVHIERDEGNGGSYLYCSQPCKEECPLYRLKPNNYINKDNKKQYNEEEYQTFRKEVLRRSDNKCEYCGEEAEHVHHSRPQKLEPFFSLDPDYGISCCEKCHYEKGHKDECSTGQLANIICK